MKALWVLGLALLLAAPAAAVDIEMSVDVPGCTGYVSGVGVCNLAGPTQMTVTWALSSQQTLNGYDLAVSWDPGELTLLSTAQRYPDNAIPLPWDFEHYIAERVHTSLGDAPAGRARDARPSNRARLVGLPRVGGLHHRYVWCEAA